MNTLTDLFQILDTAPNNEARSIRWIRWGDRHRVTVEAGGVAVTVTRHTLEGALAAAMDAYTTEARAPE
jgi:hypothetical protein